MAARHLTAMDATRNEMRDRLPISMHDAIDDLYRAFARYPQPATSDRSPYANITDEVVAQLYCRRRRAWVPVPPVSPVTRDPPAGLGTVLRLDRVRREGERDRAPRVRAARAGREDLPGW